MREACQKENVRANNSNREQIHSLTPCYICIVYLARQDERAPFNLLTLTGEKHSERRKVWNHALNANALVEYDEILVKSGLQLVDGIANSHGEVDLTAWFNYFRYSSHGPLVIRNRTNKKMITLQLRFHG